MIKGGQRTEKEYREVDLDSYSSLKEFSLDRRKYYKRYYLKEKIQVEEEESKASITGSVVDTLLFTPDEFDNRYYLSSTVSAPSANMGLFVESLYKNTHGKEDVVFEDAVKVAYKDSGYKLALDRVLERFIGTDAEIYYKEICEVRSKGLTVVTADNVVNAERIVQELKTNEFTADIVNREDSEEWSIYKQLQIEGYEVYGLILKSMLDLVQVNHKDKTIHIYDLKCVWAVESFYKEYYLYRRSYIQAYLYYLAVKSRFKELLDKGYVVQLPKFIVCDSINYYNPLIYNMLLTDLNDAIGGFVYKGETYPGVQSIIEDLLWAKDNNNWRISRKNYLNEGIVSIKQ